MHVKGRGLGEVVVVILPIKGIYRQEEIAVASWKKGDFLEDGRERRCPSGEI
jgi:hypothetical protein